MITKLTKVQLLEFDCDKIRQLDTAKIKLRVYKRHKRLTVNSCAVYKNNVLTVDVPKIDPDDWEINILAFYSGDILFCVAADGDKLMDFLIINVAVNDDYDVWVTKTQFELLTGIKIKLINHVDN